VDKNYLALCKYFYFYVLGRGKLKAQFVSGNFHFINRTKNAAYHKHALQNKKEICCLLLIGKFLFILQQVFLVFLRLLLSNDVKFQLKMNWSLIFILFLYIRKYLAYFDFVIGFW